MQPDPVGVLLLQPDLRSCQGQSAKSSRDTVKCHSSASPSLSPLSIPCWLLPTHTHISHLQGVSATVVVVRHKNKWSQCRFSGLCWNTAFACQEQILSTHPSSCELMLTKCWQMPGAVLMMLELLSSHNTLTKVVAVITYILPMRKLRLREVK